MIKKIVYLSCIIGFLFMLLFPQHATAIDVSGYTDKEIYVYGDLDVDSSGNVDGYIYTDKVKSL